jgi:hypothetical protein
LPLRHRHGYAAVLLRGLPTGKINPIQEFLPRRAVRTAIQPRSTGFELAEVLRGFTPLVPRVHLPVSLAGPAPSGSSGASRRCRGCSPPDPADSPNPATPCFCRPAATGRRCGSHTRTRITAPRGARSFTPARLQAPRGAHDPPPSHRRSAATDPPGHVVHFVQQPAEGAARGLMDPVLTPHGAGTPPHQRSGLPADQQGHGLTPEVERFRRRECSPAGGYGTESDRPGSSH